MQNWEERRMWDQDPAAAFDEAERRIAACAGTRADKLSLDDLKLDRLPPGLSSLTWLRELGLYGSPVADLDPIAPLDKLHSLKLGSLHGPFPGLHFLRGWRELQALDLICPTPLDLAPLASCTRLVRLGIYCSRHPVALENFEALQDLRSITHLSLDNMQSDRFDILAGWTALEFIQLIDAGLTSLAGFDRLRNLRHLNIRGCRISDLSPLAGLPALAKLVVDATQVHDLSPLSSLAALDELSIARTPVSELGPLADLAALQQKGVGNSGTSPRSGSGLRSIELGGCPVADLAPLSAFQRLERIDLSDTLVCSLAPLHGRSNLRSVKLDATQIESLGPPGALSGLAYLSAARTPIGDISALEPGHALQGIDIACTQVSDLRPLRSASDCRTLMLRGSRVEDLSPLLETGCREADHRYSAQALDFRETPAARANARLAELAALAETDRTACFHATKSYLGERIASGRTRRNRLLSRLLRSD